MAIKTRNTILTLSDIDIPWCYQHFLNLPHPLTGANIKIESPLKEGKDWDPSFAIYKKNGSDYKWNDLSTGSMGDIIDLVRFLKTKESKQPVDRSEAFNIIKQVFTGQITKESIYKPIPQFLNSPGRVVDSEMRRWQSRDLDYWKRFGVTKKTLEFYNVSSLEKFTMEKTVNGEKKIFEIKNPLAYGYYTRQGDLSKIYQPESKVRFINVIKYIQGSSQLKFNVSNLVIASSMKDGMAFMELDIPDHEFVAPDSENTMLGVKDIEFYISKYAYIKIMFDNDDAGKNSSKKYQDKYKFKDVLLELEKDVSDSVEIMGQRLTRLKLLQLL